MTWEYHDKLQELLYEGVTHRVHRDPLMKDAAELIERLRKQVAALEAKLDTANVDIGGKHDDILRLTNRGERLEARVIALEDENAMLREGNNKE